VGAVADPPVHAPGNIADSIADNSANDGADIKIAAVSSADNIADNVADNSANDGADIVCNKRGDGVCAKAKHQTGGV
jgi:hypothetical protein